MDPQTLQVVQQLRADLKAAQLDIADIKEAIYAAQLDVPECFGLTAHEAQIFRCLMSRKIAGKKAIYQHLYGGTRGPQDKIIDVFICKMRPKLSRYGVTITTATMGQGWFLDDAAKARVKDLLQEDGVLAA